MTDTQSAYIIIYQTNGRWRQHRPFSSQVAALESLHSLKRRFPSYAIEMVRADERILFAEVAPLADDAMELME